ncbi:hypothetical protein ENBRE01_2215 [Enteropsectra breve]|nr:hypothetical protein ENBRE01_2215 [Enteropsectra breve]
MFTTENTENTNGNSDEKSTGFAGFTLCNSDGSAFMIDSDTEDSAETAPVKRSTDDSTADLERNSTKSENSAETTENLTIKNATIENIIIENTIIENTSENIIESITTENIIENINIAKDNKSINKDIAIAAKDNAAKEARTKNIGSEKIHDIKNTMDLNIKGSENSNCTFAKSNYSDNKNDIIETIIKNNTENIMLAEKLKNLSLKKEDYVLNLDNFCFEDDDEVISPLQQLLQLEQLCILYPGQNHENAAKKVTDLLERTERTPTQSSWIIKPETSTVAENAKALRSKTYSSLEKVRAEFNRVTKDNYIEVIKSVLEIRVETIAQMKEIAAFVFEKVVNEPLFLDVYIAIIGELKKTWKTTEEMRENKSSTCFIGMLFKYIWDRVNARQNWNYDINIDGIKAANQMEFEALLEEQETERLMKKRQSIGAVEFCSELYLANIISPKNIVVVIDDLLKKESSEHVEMLCVALKKVASKFLATQKTEIVQRIINYLGRQMNSHGIRLEYLVESVLRKMPKIDGENRETKFGSGMNRFGDLTAEEPAKAVEKIIPEEEIIDNFVMGLGSKIKQSTDSFTVDEIVIIVDDFMRIHSQKKFLFAYLMETVSNYKFFSEMVEFIFKLKIENAALLEALVELKEEIPMLSMDFPVAYRQYAELLCMLRGEKQLLFADFTKLKHSEFDKHSTILVGRWKESSDARLALLTE